MRKTQHQGPGNGVMGSILSALVKKRDRNAAKSGEMAPIISRLRNKTGEATGYEILDGDGKAARKNPCPHFTMEYRTDDKTGETERVKVWENHTGCVKGKALTATQGGHGTNFRMPIPARRRTGVSSFQTHTIEVSDRPKEKCIGMVRPHKAIERRCGNWAARNHDFCKSHGGWDRKPKASTGKRIPILPERMPILVGDR